MLAKDDQVEQRVGAQAVRSMHGDTGAFTRRVQTGQDRVLLIDHHLAEFIGGDAAHGIVRSRVDRHGLGDRIDAQVSAGEIDDIGQLGEQLFTGDHIRRAIRVVCDRPERHIC